MLLCQLILSVLALFLSGCVVIPESEEDPYPSARVSKIEIGVSTKSTITSEFGQPRHSTRDDTIIAFSEDQIHATMYLLVGGPYSATIIPIPIFTRHNLVLHFSSEGTVESVEQIPGNLLGYCFSESHCFSAESNPLYMRKQAQMIRKAKEQKKDNFREKLLPKAEVGDADAQYELGSYYYTDREERWYWICRAAHGGHPEARLMMAADNLTATSGETVKSKQVALLWFFLAAEVGSIQAVDASNELSEGLNEKQIAEVRNMLRNWSPDPTICDLSKSSK